jgi:long-chain acyl-CoA synthetase
MPDPHVTADFDGEGSELLTSETARAIGARIVTSLIRQGVRHHDTVVFKATNSANLLSAVFGALLGGLAPVLISEKLNDRETREILSVLPESLTITDDLLGELARSNGTERTSSERFGCRPMHFTSGTSGRPKGVWSGWLTDKGSDDLAGEERNAWHLSSDDTHLVNGPLSHSAPLRFALHTLLNGGKVVVPRHFEPSTVSHILRSGTVTTTFMAPVHLQRLLEVGPPSTTSLRLLAHAGSPCPERVRLAAIDCFGLDALYEFYGSTEGQFTLCNAAQWQQHPGTVGRARPGRTLRVDEEGRVWCEAPDFARFEYWGDPEKTAEAWDGSWFTVGDLGHLDDDGYLYLDGRRADLVITGGVNVYPAEIERILLGSPGVTEIAVVGIDDPQWGQRVCVAFVGTASEQSLLDFSRAALASFKRPKSVIKVSALPRTPNGKIDRRTLSSLFES